MSATSRVDSAQNPEEQMARDRFFRHGVLVILGWDPEQPDT